MPKKPRPRVKLYEVVERAVQQGAIFGVTRLWKHRDQLRVEDADAYAEEIAREIMSALDEVIEL